MDKIQLQYNYITITIINICCNYNQYFQNQFSFKISFQIQELFWRNGFQPRSWKLQKDILQKMSQNIQHKFIKNYIPLFHPHFYKICAIFLRSSYPQHYGRHVTTTVKIFNIIKVTPRNLAGRTPKKWWCIKFQIYPWVLKNGHL